jgi:TorA maturation chaperone TorD
LSQSGSRKANLTEVSKVNLTRAAMYSFLSRAFKTEVDERFLQDVIEIETTLKLLSESQSGGELKEANTLLIEFAKQFRDLKGDKRDAFIIDLAAEYARLFLGVSERPVHLVESVYLSKDHLLYQEPYHEIVQAYKSLGYEKDKDFKEPEDHVAVEFEFMANLCKWTSKSLDKGDVEKGVAFINLQREFLRDHIDRWVPLLCEQLEKEATSPFYKALAHLTKGFITLDDGIPDHLTEVLRNKI